MKTPSVTKDVGIIGVLPYCPPNPVSGEISKQIEFILSSIGIGISIVDSDRNIRYVDPFRLSLYGEPKGKKCYEYFRGRDVDCPGCGIKKALETKQMVCAKMDLSQGEDGPVRVIVLPFQTDKGEWLAAEANIPMNLFNPQAKEHIPLGGGTPEFVDISADWTWRTDENDHFVFVSPNISGLLGYDSTEMIGRRPIDFALPEDLENFREMIEPVIKAQKSLAFVECKLAGKDGDVRYVELSGAPVFDGKGKFRGYHGTVRDITDRRVAEEALRRSEKLLRSILEILPVGVWLMDETGRLVKCNPAAEKIWGGAKFVGPEQFGEYKGWWAKTGKLIEAKDWAATRAIEKGETSIGEEIIIEAFEGVRKTILNSALPLNDAGGKPLGAIIVSQDITDLKRNEELLAEHNRFLQELIDAIPMPVFYKDTDGLYRGCNRAFQEFVGRKKEEIVGKNVFDINPPDLARKYRQADKILLKNGGTQTYEAKVRNAEGGEQDVVFYKATFGGKDGAVAGLIGTFLDISERKKMEREIRESKEQFRRLVENLGSGYFFYRHDANGALTYLSPSVKDMLGYDPEEARGNYVKYLTPNPINKAAIENTEKAIKGERCPSYEIEIYDKGGKVRRLELTEAPVIDPDGQVIAVEGIAYDITERKMAEEALRAREAILNGITESAQDAILMIDGDGNISFWNSAATRVLGYAREEAIGKNLHELLAPARFLPAHRQAFPEFQRTGQGAAVGKMLELIAVHKDGHEFPIELSLASLQLNGRWCAVGIMRDITVRKSHENQLAVYSRLIEEKNQELDVALKEMTTTRENLALTVAMFTAMIDVVPAVMYLKDAEGKYVIVNQEFCRWTGKEMKDIIGKTAQSVLSEDEAVFFSNLDERVCVHGEKIVEMEKETQRPNGDTGWVAITVLPVKNDKGEITGLVGLIRDVTEQHISRQQLIQSDKLAAIGTLAAGVAHEINNPIGFINSNLNTMLKYHNKIKQSLLTGEGEKLSPEETGEIFADWEDAIKESIDGANRVKKIVADLKSFSRVDRAQKEHADINEGIRSTLNIVWNELKYKCKVETEFGDIPELFCIPNQLNQVFMNIIVNAGHAITGNSGLIKIKTWASQDKIHISIKDNGCGIPEENIKKIFEPFFTTKEVGKGTGLGLSLAYDIVKKHNGTIEVKSKVGVGTEFIISLPLEGIGDA
jgi:two-component system NtrC family sensor kinase